MAEKYITYSLRRQIGDWKAEWFYIDNHAPALPERTPGPPKPRHECPGPAPKKRRVVEERAPVATTRSDMAESSRRAGGAGSQPSEEEMANRSYLKSQKLKVTETGRQNVALLEAENAALKKDKAALEQRVRMLKDVIQKNRGSTEEHQKELQELQVAARTVVEFVDSADESDGNLANRL
ncbi:uncharacterized protein LOC120695250 [Panicum virgatum]|uniref:uncharacterized protein LOC120695250 n=1 Tax=Panicum virgatum TaxID=38727 RepID=UPI0019D5135D|nr:uncharacterized protein LOC120695250 [Panicum virgatum]